MPDTFELENAMNRAREFGMLGGIAMMENRAEGA